MREAQEVERFWFASAMSRTPLRGETPEFNQARLLAVQRETEPAKAALQLLLKSYGLPPVLEADDEIIRVPNHDHVAACVTPPPLVGPQIEHVMEIDIR